METGREARRGLGGDEVKETLTKGKERSQSRDETGIQFLKMGLPTSWEI